MESSAVIQQSIVGPGWRFAFFLSSLVINVFMYLLPYNAILPRCHFKMALLLKSQFMPSIKNV